MIAYSAMHVIGGTCRFVGASGSISGTAVDAWPGGPDVATFHGTLTYDASSVAGG